MKIKRLLAWTLLIASPFFIIFAATSQNQVRDVLHQLSFGSVWVSLIFAVSILMLAHLVRAYKTKQIVDTIKITSWRTHTRALFIGYLFNALLPFRLGEIVRAFVAGKGTRMSSTFMFGLVMLDRAVDGFILGLIALFLLTQTTIFSAPAVHGIVVAAIVVLFGVGTFLMVLLYLFRQQPAWLLSACYHVTNLFNDRLRDSIRFKLWSLMYGLERVIHPRRMLRYVGMSLFMWILYMLAILPLTYRYLDKPAPSTVAGTSTISYLGIAAPAGPSYIGSYQTFVDPYIDSQSNAAQMRNLLLIVWLLQIIPACLVGLVFVLRTQETMDRPADSATRERSELTGDKLLRDVDVSHDLGAFLDAFFTNNSLSRIMHRMEVAKDSKLIRYFKGGSDAITALVYENKQFVVRKITPIQYKYKLKSQYDWLNDRAKIKHIVNAISEETSDSYYKIDLEYNEEFIPFFDYIHSMPVSNSKRILTNVFGHLFKNVYKLSATKTRLKDLDSYIENRCVSKIRQAAEVNDEIRALVEYDELIINGKRYKNIHKVIDEILADTELRKMLATYRKCSIHGDVTIDNILACKDDNRFLLIDPNDNENEISGPVFDFGRLGESVLYGYEFLNRDDSKVTVREDHIDFEHARSHNYAELEKHLAKLRKQHLTPEENKAVGFHTAIMYSRMLTHRVKINPRNASKYYATSVVAFNDFLDSYRQHG